MAFAAQFLALCLISVALSCAADNCLSDKRFQDENRLTKLETAVKELQNENLRLKQSNMDVKAELAATRNVFKDCVSLYNRTWALKRVNYVVPSLAKVQLHQKTAVYTEKIPQSLLNKNTKAVIVSVFCNFWNTGGHAYMNLDFNQKGNEDSGSAHAPNTHYAVSANTFYYEIMIPWDSKFGNEVVFKVSHTYNTGGSDNWYQVKVVGTVTH